MGSTNDIHEEEGWYPPFVHQLQTAKPSDGEETVPLSRINDLFDQIKGA